MELKHVLAGIACLVFNSVQFVLPQLLRLKTYFMQQIHTQYASDPGTFASSLCRILLFTTPMISNPYVRTYMCLTTNLNMSEENMSTVNVKIVERIQ